MSRKDELVAIWDAAVEDERQRKAAEAARQAALADPRQRVTKKIRYRNTDESGGVAVEPFDEGADA